jgi:hypothetical protein
VGRISQVRVSAEVDALAMRRHAERFLDVGLVFAEHVLRHAARVKRAVDGATRRQRNNCQVL